MALPILSCSALWPSPSPSPGSWFHPLSHWSRVRLLDGALAIAVATFRADQPGRVEFHRLPLAAGSTPPAMAQRPIPDFDWVAVTTGEGPPGGCVAGLPISAAAACAGAVPNGDSPSPRVDEPARTARPTVRSIAWAGCRTALRSRERRACSPGDDARLRRESQARPTGRGAKTAIDRRCGLSIVRGCAQPIGKTVASAGLSSGLGRHCFDQRSQALVDAREVRYFPLRFSITSTCEPPMSSGSPRRAAAMTRPRL